MTTLTPTDAWPSHPRFAAAADAGQPRVTYAQRLTPAGERAFGHFYLPVGAVIAALVERPADEHLQLWLRHHDSDESDHESTPLALPPASAEAALVVEELFGAGQARAFCSCCNRNIAARDVRLVRSTRPGEAVHYRYLCPTDHLLLAVATAQIVAVAESRAA